MIIYTDTEMSWFADSLAEAALDNQIQISTTLLDEMSLDDMIEIQQSFGIYSMDTLLVGIFSPKNVAIDLINDLFPALHVPLNFSGYSLITVQEIPPQILDEFLMLDYSLVINGLNEISSTLTKNQSYQLTTQSGTNLTFTLDSDIEVFPFHPNYSTRHVLFPCTEAVATIKRDSMNGTLIVDVTVGAYREEGIIVDPFGKIKTPLKLEFSNGKISNVDDDHQYGERLTELFGSWAMDDLLAVKIGFGLGPDIVSIGDIIVDKQIKDTFNIGINNRTLEFVALNPLIKPISNNN